MAAARPAYTALACYGFSGGTAPHSGKGDEQDILECWRKPSKQYNHLVGQFNDSLYATFDGSEFLQFAKRLDEDPRFNRSKQLRLRSILFQLSGKRYFEMPFVPIDFDKLEIALYLADALGDKFLLASVYAVAADMNHLGAFVRYAVKSLELQEELGVQSFQNSFRQAFVISAALYNVADYANALRYGGIMLNYAPAEKSVEYERLLVLQLDVLGATHLSLQQFKQARKYYEQLLEVLNANQHLPADLILIWRGIATGRLGALDRIAGQPELAIIKLAEQYRVAKVYALPDNAAIARYELGLLLLEQGRYLEALASFSEALGDA